MGLERGARTAGWVMCFTAALWTAQAAAQCPVVSTTADDVSPAPPGSLRDCLTRANASPEPDVITFDAQVFSPGVIRLRAPLPAISDPGGLRLEGGEASRVIIDGQDVRDVIGLDVRSAVELSGLTVRGFREGSGVYVRGGARLRLERCHLIGNRGGVVFEGVGSGHTLIDSRFEGNGSGVRWFGPGNACHTPRSLVARNLFVGNNVGGSGDDVFLVSQGCVDVLDNRFEGNADFGVRLATSSQVEVKRNVFFNAPIGVFGGSKDNRFEDNRLEHDAGVALIIGDPPGSTDNRLVGNVFRSTGAALGVFLYDVSSTTRLFHNTFTGYREAAVRVVAEQDVDVRNNLFVDLPLALRGVLGPRSRIDTNGFFQVARVCEGCDAGAVIEGDPGFLDWPKDLRLSPCSAPAIDRGSDLGPEQPPARRMVGVSSASRPTSARSRRRVRCRRCPLWMEAAPTPAKAGQGPTGNQRRRVARSSSGVAAPARRRRQVRSRRCSAAAAPAG